MIWRRRKDAWRYLRLFGSCLGAVITRFVLQLFAKYFRVLDKTERELHDMEQVLTLRARSGDAEEAEEAQLELQLLNNEDARYLKVVR